MNEQDEKKLFEMCVKMGMSFEQFQQTKRSLDEKFSEKSEK